MSDVVNIYEHELQWDEGDPPGYNAGHRQIGPLLGAIDLGMTIAELPSGQSICPYHFEYGREEWLFVLEGRPTLRTPEGERELDPGDLACFPEGPDGAHKVTNRGAGRVRVAMLSTKQDPTIAVYPDSNKIGAWTAKGEHRVIARLGADVDYYDGEL